MAGIQGNYGLFAGTPLQEVGRTFGGITGWDITNNSGPKQLTAEQRASTAKKSAASGGSSSKSTSNGVYGGNDAEPASSAASYAGGGSYIGGGGGGVGNSAADERAYYDDQINALNSLLGYTNSQMDSGLGRLNASFNDQAARLAEQKAKTLAGYDQQSLENAQDKQRGVESVDQFANNSYNSLQRLLAGAGAGSSSVARELLPYLVSKSAGTRRQGVFDQAGKNDQAISMARGDAIDQYGYSEQDLQNQRRSQEEQFRQNILNQQNDLLGKRQALEIQRAQANGAGYNAARAAAAGTQGEIANRQNQLAALFGQFNPTFNARAVNVQTPELGKFTVDPAQINADQAVPAEARYYLPQYKKRQEGLV